MATLTPVDDDPFATGSSASSPKLTPVDHDPFATGSSSAASGQGAQPGWTDYLLQHLAGDTSLNPNAPGKTLGQTAFWNKPADVSWGDYAQAHLQPLEDIGRSAANTFGVGDRLIAQGRATLPMMYPGLFGQDASAVAPGGAYDPATQQQRADAAFQEERAKTTATEARMPTQDRLAASVIGSGPLGEVAGSLRAAPYLSKLPGWLASRIAGATVGGGSTAAGEVGRGESLSPKDIAIGTLAGGVVGAPGPRGQGALAPPVPEDVLRANAKTAFAPLDEMVFHGPSQVKSALDAVKNTMTQSEQDLAATTIAKVDKLASTNLVTGSDIQSYQKIFGGLSKTGSDMDKEFAPKFKSALEDIMQNTTPYGRNTTPGQGMSLMLPGSLGGTGLAAGEAAAARDAGNIQFGRANDVARLDDPNAGWIAKAQVSGGPDVGDQVGSWLNTATGQRYAPRPAPGLLQTPIRRTTPLPGLRRSRSRFHGGSSISSSRQ